MNLLSILKELAREIHRYDESLHLDALITHIERAEILYIQGQKLFDEDYFTDVIYRTNQAFEGSLRFAYSILAEKSEEETNRLRTIDIESYLEKRELLKERVLHHLRNYRREWRNKSTHDYRLFFDESEALFAILNVSAFSYVLLKQIIQKLAFIKEEESLNKLDESISEISKIISDSSLPIDEKFIKLIEDFSIGNTFLSSEAAFQEIELSGMFEAYSSVLPELLDIDIDVPFVSKGNKYYFDFVATMGSEKLLIEFKRPNITFRESYIDQVEKYLEAAKLEKGILWIPSMIEEGERIKVETFRRVGPQGEKTIHVIKK